MRAKMRLEIQASAGEIFERIVKPRIGIADSGRARRDL